VSSFDIDGVHKRGSTPEEAVAALVEHNGAYRVYAYANAAGGKHSNYKFCLKPSDEEGLKSSPYCHNIKLVWDWGTWLGDPET